MARLYLFAEGSTEQTFADTVLKPHLANHGVFLHPPVLIAHARKKGKVHRGGGRKYLPMKMDISRFLAQERGRDVFFTTMIDLYGLHGDFPKRAEAEKFRRLPRRRVEFLEQAFAADIGDLRFIPHIQLHEFETCLFCGPRWLEYFFDHHAQEIAALEAVANQHTNPEDINDGPHSAPSKRIIAQLPGYAKAKPVVGPQVAELNGLDVIRAKCPHFAAWLSRLEGLGRSLPTSSPTSAPLPPPPEANPPTSDAPTPS